MVISPWAGTWAWAGAGAGEALAQIRKFAPGYVQRASQKRFIETFARGYTPRAPPSAIGEAA